MFSLSSKDAISEQSVVYTTPVLAWTSTSTANPSSFYFTHLENKIIAQTHSKFLQFYPTAAFAYIPFLQPQSWPTAHAPTESSWNFRVFASEISRSLPFDGFESLDNHVKHPLLEVWDSNRNMEDRKVLLKMPPTFVMLVKSV